MISYINIDAILSDPLLLTAAVLLLVGPILFLISLWKLIRSPRKKDPLFDMEDATPEPEVKVEKPASLPPVRVEPKAEIEEPISDEPESEDPTPPPPPAPSALPVDMDKTVVMPAGMAEVQGQLEIAFSQIKHLNKKVYDLENALNASGGASRGAPPSGDLKAEMPTNAADFAQKLLKLAEHVIMLEKTLNRLMAEKKAENVRTVEPAQPKPPIMPL